MRKSDEYCFEMQICERFNRDYGKSKPLISYLNPKNHVYLTSKEYLLLSTSIFNEIIPKNIHPNMHAIMRDELLVIGV